MGETAVASSHRPRPLLMKRTLFILAIGCLLGYSMGFKDARRHEQPVYERMLDKVGGAARGKYGGDIDQSATTTDR